MIRNFLVVFGLAVSLVAPTAADASPGRVLTAAKAPGVISRDGRQALTSAWAKATECSR